MTPVNTNFAAPASINYNFEPTGELKIQCLRECGSVLLDTPEEVKKYLINEVVQSVRHCWDKENFVVLFLDARKKVTGFEIISCGILDSVLVHAREVFRPAIVANAHSIIVAHNHPGGDPAPSTADIRVTRDLIRAGQMLKLELVDHVIYTKNGLHASLKEMGQFYS